MVYSANCNIFTTNRYKDLEATITNNTTINTTISTTIPDTDYSRGTINNCMAKNKFNQNQQSIVYQWKQVVVNQHPENQTVFNSVCKSSCKFAADRKKFYEASIVVSSGSIPKGRRWKEFNNYVKFDKARFFGFPGANSKQLSIYIDVNHENSSSDTVIIYVGINGPLNGSNEPQIDSLIQNIGTIIKNCWFHGMKSIFISV